MISADFVAIPAITILCYLAAEVFKLLAGEDKYKAIPALCGLVGGTLGVVCYFCFTGDIPADNPVVAAAVGAVSGWAATGVNQIIKQAE